MGAKTEGFKIFGMPLYLEFIAFLYIVLVGLTCYLVEFPEILKSFLALPSFVLLPLLFGNAILFGVSRFFKSASLDHVSIYIFSWFIGVFSLTVGAALFQLFELYFIIQNLHLVTLVVIALSLLWKGCLNNNRIENQAHRFFSRLKNSDLLLCVFIGLIPALIARSRVPFGYFGFGFMIPTIINQPALRIIEHGYMDLSWIRWPEYLLTALSCMTFNCEPMSFNWSLPFLLAPLYAVGLYVLSYRLFKNRAIALLAVFFGVFLNIGSSPNTFFFGQFIENPRSNTMLYALFPLTLFLVDKEISTKNYKTKEVVISLFALAILLMTEYIFLESDIFIASALNTLIAYKIFVLRPITMLILPFAGFFIARFFVTNEFSKATFQKLLMIALTFLLFHKYEYLLFISTIFLYILLKQLTKEHTITFLIRIKEKTWNSPNLPFYIMIGVSFSFIFLQWIGILELYSNASLSPLFFPSLSPSEPINSFIDKRFYFEDANSPIILALLIIGATLILFSKDRKELFILTMFSLTLFIYFLPDPSTRRAFKEFSPFMAIVLAITIHSINDLLTKACSYLGQIRMKRYLTPLYFTLILTAIIPSLIMPVYNRFSFSPPGHQHYTTIADYEYETALWLRENTPENTRIISDYRTMVMLTPLANKIWLTGKGMRVSSLSNEKQQIISYIKNEIFLAPDSKQAYEAIWNLSNDTLQREQKFIEATSLSQFDKTLVIIISTRTVKWIEKPGINDIVDPQYGGVDQKYYQKFLDSNYFSLLFNITDEIYVFKVKSRG